MRIISHISTILLAGRTISQASNLSISHDKIMKTTRLWISNFVANPKLQLCPWAASTLVNERLKLIVHDFNYVSDHLKLLRHFWVVKLFHINM